MSEFKIKGGIKLINDVKVISDKFSVREFVLTTEDSKYPQDIMFQTVNDRMSMLDTVKRGDAVEVSFNVRGREFNGKYYNTLDAYKVERPVPREQSAHIAPPIDTEDNGFPF